MAKTKKKTAPKKATAKKVSAKKVPAKNKQVKLKIDKSKLSEYAKSAGKILTLLLVDLFVQYLNNDYSVAIVNGQRIPRREYIKNLETIHGAQVADALVEEELVKQLGQKEGIEIESEDVDEAYDEIETQLGGEEALSAALVQNNMSADDLRGQLENELVLKKIIEPKLEYTDEDLADFFEQYKDMLYEDPSEIDFEEKRDEIESYYIEQKTFEERDIILGEFQEESTIKINVPGVSEDDTGYGFFKATRDLIANFTEEHNTN